MRSFTIAHPPVAGQFRTPLAKKTRSPAPRKVNKTAPQTRKAPDIHAKSS